MKRFQLNISGRVQGVFYRKSTQEMALGLNLKGSVKNLPDGRVFVEAEGKKEHLERLLHWCYEGPPASRVVDIEVKWLPPVGLNEFRILH